MSKKEAGGRAIRPHPNSPSRFHLVWIAILFASMSACLAPESHHTPALTREPSPSEVSSHNPTPRMPPTAPPLPTSTLEFTARPQALTLAVPEHWRQAASQALEAVNTDGGSWRWSWIVEQDPAASLAQGRAQAALVPGEQGMIVAQRPLALAVPFSADWDNVSLAEALELKKGESPFVAVLDWSDVRLPLKSLKVNGRLPGEADYPLHQSWSLLAAPGIEQAAAALAPRLGETLRADPVVSLAAVGDLMLDRGLGESLQAGDLDYPFEQVAEVLRAADVTVGNLECALGQGGVPAGKSYTFQAPPQAAQALSLAGFDLLSLANNHSLDYGPDRLLQGMDLLKRQGIATVGAGADENAAHRPYRLEIHGLTLGFLAYVDVPVEVRGFDARLWTAGDDRPGVAWADPERIRADVSALRSQTDLVVVLLHSGYENVPQPSPVQQRAANAAIESGAHLVIGHHAHVLQGLDVFEGRAIAYGLGNFAFEDGGPPESALLQVWLDAQGVRQLAFFPVILEGDGRPRPASQTEARAILQQLDERTADRTQP